MLTGAGAVNTAAFDVTGAPQFPLTTTVYDQGAVAV